MASIVIIENHDLDGIDRVRVHGEGCKDIAKDSVGNNSVHITEMDATAKLDVLERIADDNCEEVEDVEARFLPCCKF